MWFTHLRLVGLSVLGQLDELLGEHAAAVSQDVALQLHVGIGTHELHHDGVAGGVDPNLDVLATHWGGKRGGEGRRHTTEKQPSSGRSWRGFPS